MIIIPAKMYDNKINSNNKLNNQMKIKSKFKSKFKMKANCLKIWPNQLLTSTSILTWVYKIQLNKNLFKIRVFLNIIL